MGKRSRHSVKTGDAFVSKKKSQSAPRYSEDNNDDDSENDGMYNEVERYHNRKTRQEDEDYLQLDQHDNINNSNDSDDDDDMDDGITHQEGVFDLGVGGSSSEDDDEDDEDEDEDSEEDDRKVVEKQKQQQQQQRGVNKTSTYASYDNNSDNYDSDDDDDSDNDDDDDTTLYDKSKILNWGDKKSAYYHGDTADLEIGQNLEDAYLEEEAAREILANQAKYMDEEDYMLGGGTGGGGVGEEESSMNGGSAIKIKKTTKTKKSTNNEMEIIQSIKNSKNISQLTTQERLKHVTTTHPELLPLVSHFSKSADDLNGSTLIAASVMLQKGIGKCIKEMEAVGATPAGLQYLITKSMIQASETLNLVLYLLLKSDQASTAKKMNNDTTTTPFLMDIVDTSDDIANHPVIQRLNQLSILTDKLQAGVEDKMPGLNDQMKNLVKAATLMAGGDLSLSDNDDGSETRDNASSKEGDERIVESLDGSEQHDKHDEDEMNRNPHVKKREIYRKALISRKGADEYEKEEEEDDDEEESSSESDDQYETQEAIQRKVMTEAKFALRNQDIDQDMKYLTKKRVHRLAPPAMSSDYGDETDEVTDQTLMASRKLASMMNSIVQKSSSSNDKRNKSMARDDDEEDDYDKVQRGLSMMEEELGKGSDDDDDDDDDEDGDDDDEGLRDSDEDDFYKSIKSKSKARKDAKKVMYEVAPKFPRLDIMVDGERAIGGQIMKNRGLVPHKPKINRNPRVKKREKYRKALISRKGAVREIRTEEGHVYGGETTGIKSGISRSRKLGR